jgi:pimeloyl-ACP methyl ester carboxylesterase
VFLLPARLEQEDEARTKLLRLADLLETHPLEEVAEMVLAEEDAEGLFDRYPAWRDRRREAILSMNREGLPHAIREAIADPPVTDPEPLRRVTAPALVVGQEGDPVHRAEVARELASNLPNAELLLFEDRDELLSEVAALTQRIATFLVG